MSQRRAFVERRQHERYKLKDGIVAVAHASMIRFGKIRDISMGGLTVCYFDKQGWEGKTFQVDLMTTDGDLSLDQVPIKMKFDMENNTLTPYCILHERQCGLQFGDLSREQLAMLENFLQNRAEVAKL
jgi:hypothetical protein